MIESILQKGSTSDAGVWRISIVLTLTLVLCAGFADSDLSAQISYQHGQNVSPAFEGWEENDDGTFNLVFGYMNRNWEEELNVSVGPDNTMSPGPEDKGQPTRFLPRRNRFVFKVVVPADFGEQEMIWTLTTQGKTEYAYGSLRMDYKLDNVVIASETGALGIGVSDAAIRANTTPVLTLEGDAVRRVRVGEAVTIINSMVDDGLEAAIERSNRDAERAAAAAAEREGPATLTASQLRPPMRITVAKRVAHHVACFVLRGEAEVTFDPPQVKTWEDTRAGANSPWSPLWARPPVPPDGRWEVRVTASEPGTYVVRCRGDDGALYHDQDVTIIISRVAAQEF
jgi:hypothetical protein